MLHLLLSVYLNTTRIEAIDNNTVTIAWDAPSDDRIVGYRIYRGDPPCDSYPDSIDVGNRTQYTWSSGKIDMTKNQCFSATAYDSSGTESDFADPALWTPVIQGVDTCTFPLGVNAISLFAGRVVDTSRAVGSRLSVQFQIASPGSKITQIDVVLSIGQQPVTVKSISGTDLGDIGALWFFAPTTAGTYPLTVQVTNVAGCIGKLSNGADTQPMKVTVK